MLSDLAISRFKVFSDLVVPQLGGVNLVVGKNNVGKTILLEALRLYGSPSPLFAVENLLFNRDELVGIDGSDGEARPHIEALFAGRKIPETKREGFSVGPATPDSSSLKVYVEFRRYQRLADGRMTFEAGDPTLVEIESPDQLHPVFVAEREGFLGHMPIRNYGSRKGRRYLRGVPGLDRLDPVFVRSHGVSDLVLARWWDRVSLKDAERRVVECLSTIAPVERVSLVEHPYSRSRRMPIVLLKGHRTPVPLKSLGDGMTRLLTLSLGLECARGGGNPDADEAVQQTLFDEIPATSVPRLPPLFLVDEIENGIHYTALERLWEFVFAAARRQGVQVFATSHSWDCVRAFQAVAGRQEETRGVLVRLERQGDRTTKAVCFSEEELAVVARERIEVR